MIGYITSLCGYPTVSTDKMNVLLEFLRETHGHNTSEELSEAYKALAAGRLDEKMDNFKSITGMSASRVLQSYLRNKKTETQTYAPEGRSFASDDTKELIFKYNGRQVMFNDEVTQDEHYMLMDHWIEKHLENYRLLKRPDLLTSTGFDYLEKKGILRVSGGMLQKKFMDSYMDLKAWTTIETMAVRMKFEEDSMITKNRSNLKKMLSPTIGMPLDEVKKKVALWVYFDSL